MVPCVDHVKICSFQDDPALSTRHGVFSTDIVTDTVRINRENLAFSLTPKRARLNVIFLDFDATENFVDTRLVPFGRMYAIWYTVICTCLDVAIDPIAYTEYEYVQSRWRHFF